MSSSSKAVMGEITGFNAGIIAVVSNEATIGLYREWVDRARATPPQGRIGNTFPENICKDLLNEGKEAGTIKASGLPYRYGFLGPDTKIYHAINGGDSCMSKEFVLEMSSRYIQGTHQFNPDGPLQELVQANWGVQLPRRSCEEKFPQYSLYRISGITQLGKIYLSDEYSSRIW